MNERIKDKILEIETYLEELHEIIPSNFEDYKKDFKSKAACERYAEKIIEALVDLAFLIIKENKFKIPEDDENSFDILFENSIIKKDLEENLKNAKGMRNIIAHEYGKIDDEIVYDSISRELIKDAREFIESIEKNLKKRKNENK